MVDTAARGSVWQMKTSRKQFFGQEAKTPPAEYISAERGPTAKEVSLWERASKIADRVTLTSHSMKLQYMNLLMAYQFAKTHGVSLPTDEMSMLEPRMQGALSAIERLKDDMADVRYLRSGIRVSADGTDLDILQPTSQSLGWILPVVIGAVIVVGIIARWIHLETEVQTISDQYNGILRHADLELCKDPSSQTCKDWETTKSHGAYSQRETVIDSVKNAVTKIGSSVSRGLGAGLMLAIPVLMMLYLPRKKD